MLKFEHPLVIDDMMMDDLCRHSSDSNFMIRKVGTEELYLEAIDVYPCVYSYEETNIPIEGGT